ncbi:MAG: virulence factor [Acidimicrobiales bacterium]
MAAQLITIWWRDIPAQVNAQHGRSREKRILDDRFQVAIDRAAMVAGITTTDAYVQEWRRTTVPLTGDLVDAVDTEVARLDDVYDAARLKILVEAGGVAAPDDQHNTEGDER